MAALSVWVDDHHPIFLTGMIAALRSQDFRIAGRSVSLVGVAFDQLVDVLVFDASTSDQIALAVQSGIPCVAVVQNGAVDRATEAADAGVQGLVVRQDLTPRQLASAVRAAHQGTWTCPVDLAGLILAGGKRIGPAEYPLTEREYRVLELLANGLSTQEIAQEMAYSSRTIKNQVQSILTKLDCRNRAQAVGLAVREGWI